MTKLQLATKLADELDSSTNIDLLTVIKDWIDDILSDIINELKWEFLNETKELQLVSGDSTLTVDGVSDIIAIQRKDQHTTIPKVSIQTMTDFAGDLTESGPPYGWWIDSFTQATQSWLVRFNQVADQNYDLFVFCKKEIAPLGDTDEIPFPIQLDAVIKNGVRYMYHLNEDSYQAATLFENLYQKGLAKYISTYGEMTSDRVMARSNSDLQFVRTGKFYDVNLDLERGIPEV